MRVIDKIGKLDRRDFLGGAAAGTALAAAAPAIAQAPVAPLKTAPASAQPTLVRMARDLYPHDRLPDLFYENAVATIDTGLAADPESKTLLADGVVQLDAASRKLKGRPYAAIAGEGDRVAVLRTMETTAFFKKMRSGMVTALYNQQGLWARFGYEGASADKGGYLHRGFNDIDWLLA